MDLRKIILGAAIFGLFQIPVSHAQDDQLTCSFYSKVGSSVVGYMLPLTVQELVDMMTGKNPDLMTEMTGVMLRAMNAEEFQAIFAMDANRLEMLGEAAGAVSFQVLMSGKATSVDEVERILLSSCLSIGPDVIIDNQIASNAAAARNINQ